ncbi:carboxyltransferase domain-containing protein [Coraliomargarita algicola]|uniref:Carboxyltransferase domain-containing protein n=1 Tax=Coraliomargarita algicola TaxID=3092156 RepID=A0ABZ0RLT2_9BACT|nr:carboxyltransferase domain-containing protein [Coraliomargarita sp. J2-16]WPJ96376.1 carboxyltransferase domain-containing protein [Coraliomargarita sp. J2-16]
MVIKPYGDRGILLAALSESERRAWLGYLAQQRPRECAEYVVGYDSILLIRQGAASCEELENSVNSLAACWGLDAANGADAPLPMPPARLDLRPQNCHIIEVYYNGADLESVAQACKLSVEQVIQLHSAPLYTVRMMGFSPGFPYLEGLDARLQIERRASPRNRIDAGTVAIGGPHAGIYTVASPGGWHLLGHTDFPLFNLNAARQKSPSASAVFALSPGDQVRFQPKATPC